MSSIFKATHITYDKMLAQPSAYGLGAIHITTGLNAFRDPSGFRHAWNLPQASSSPTSPWLYATAARDFNLDLILLVLEYLNDAQAIGVVYLCMCVQGHFDVGISARNGPKGAFWGHLIGAAVLFLLLFWNGVGGKSITWGEVVC
jgi:hypothetical protein